MRIARYFKKQLKYCCLLDIFISMGRTALQNNHKTYNYGTMEKISGIYCVKNKINGKCYVGQSINIHRRFSAHMSPSQWVIQKQSFLYKDVREFGLGNFSFEVLELVEGKEKLNEREIYWISKLNSVVPNGYNISEGGNRGAPLKISKKQLYEIVELLKNGASAKEIQRLYRISIQMITDINVGRCRHINGMDYPIRKHPSSYTGEYYCPCCGKKIIAKTGMCSPCRYEYNEIKVYGKKGEELKKELRELYDAKVPLVKIGKKYGVTNNAIKKKLKKYNILP